jgi:ABC-type uncharacterized transport system substrate-binding protein
LINLPEAIFTMNVKRITEFATKNKLPAMCTNPQSVDGGCLMSYGPNQSDLYRRGATYVDKILKGVKPADLPVEQPTKFDFVINLKTAKQIGLTIPQKTMHAINKRCRRFIASPLQRRTVIADSARVAYFCGSPRAHRGAGSGLD